MKNLFKDRDNRIIVIIGAIVMLLACNQLISRYCITGHDLEYHLLRIESIKEGILAGRPFLKVNLLFFGGAGYASSMFYSDFLLYIPAVLRALGMSIHGSYHIFAFICVLLCFLSAYYSGYYILKNKYAGLMAGILLTLCPYYLDDVLVRGAVGEYMAFIFVPIVICSVYNIVYEGMSRPLLFIVGFAGVILSHPATTVMCVMMAVAVFIIKCRILFSHGARLWGKVILFAGIVLLITASYLLPMLEQFMDQTFYVSVNENDMLYSAIDFSFIFSQQFPTMGFMLLLFALPLVVVWKERDDVIGFAGVLMIIGAGFAVLSTNLLPWQYLSKIFSFVQFPWRFFVLASCLFAVADTIVLYKMLEKLARDLLSSAKDVSPLYQTTVILVLVAMAISSLIHQNENRQEYYDYSNDYYSYKPFTAGVIAGEWLPATVTDRDSIIEQSETMLTDAGCAVDYTLQKGVITANLTDACEYADVPFIYYKGYRAELESASGKKNLNVTNEGENGFARVYLHGETGNLTVTYKGTVVLYISIALSVLGVAAAIAYAVLGKRGKRNEMA